MASSTTISSLKNAASTILEAICNTHDFDLARALASPNIKTEHDDNPPIEGSENFFANFQALLKFAPDFHMEIHSLIAEINEDGKGGRVWVYSTITGLPGGTTKASIDMMEFDADGLVLSSKDVQRELVKKT